MTTTKGLEGITASQSSISSIIDATLTYRGIDIDELATKSCFEEVIFLLWFGKLPNKNELEQLKHNLNANSKVPVEIIDLLRKSPKTAHSMTVLRTAISALGMFDKEAEDNSLEANFRKAVRLQAKIPTIVAAMARIRKGKSPVAPREGLTIAENFLYMLNNELPNETAVEAIDKALILHADHEFNASTFSSRVTVATLSDIYSGFTSAIGTLKGPLHGGANEAVMSMLEKIGEVSNVEAYINKALENKEKIMGMGHRVYKNGDPRAKHLKEMSKKLTDMIGQPKWYLMSTLIEGIVEREKQLKPNVDFYSASVYYSLGLEKEIYTPIFAISRASGWLAHMLEQYQDNRLIRPRAEYVGPVNVKYVPIDKR